MLNTSLPRTGLPLSAADLATQAVVLCAVTPNSRESSAGVHPVGHRQFDALLLERRAIWRLGLSHFGLEARAHPYLGDCWLRGGLLTCNCSAGIAQWKSRNPLQVADGGSIPPARSTTFKGDQLRGTGEETS